MTRTRLTKSLRARALSEAPEFPKIIVRRPRRGDTHPISLRPLRGALHSFPPAYLHGLKLIELAPRGANVGEPFAKYRPDERKIFLYSLPMTWSKDRISYFFARSVQRYGAQIIAGKDSVTVHWDDEVCRCVWFVLEVLTHELGHHYRHQNRFRRKISRPSDEEVMAHLHAWRIQADRRNKKSLGC